ncbi:MAG: hypothetical protein LBL55_07045 [Propionibacteriaceae bacterium]|jgi:hypothetical protein|nr:hypothetical protein [Propionibacteriaceae bacterium]
MATWQDGPAYAPLQRPLAFAQPTSGVSLAPPAAPPGPPPPPTQPPPAFAPPTEPVTPLAQLRAAPADQRDPHQPFEVVEATLTSASAWGSVHSTAPGATPWQAPSGWVADQPWQSSYAPPDATSQFPTPGTPQWFGPSSYQTPAQLAQPVTLSNLLQATSVPYLLTLVLGLFIQSLSPACLLVATFFIATVVYRRKQMMLMMGVLWGFIIMAGIFTSLSATTFELTQAALACCGLAAVGGLIIQFFALRAGDRPERTRG